MTANLTPVADLAAQSTARWPNEAAAYRKARTDLTDLLAGKIELRRHIHRDDETIRHFYSAEGGLEVADPGQHPHSAPDMNPLWVLLDTTFEGRGRDCYPKLED